MMQKLIKKLKRAGVRFDPGMTAFQLDRAEAFFGFRFPRELREFLMLAVPVGEDFFDYRDCSEENRKRFVGFYERMEASFRFDLENCRDLLLEFVGEKLGFMEDGPGFDDAVMACWRASPKLVPFYAHRCFFDGLDDMPIVSFWQPVDTILYGSDLKRYLEAEFLGVEDLTDIPERMKETGIWSALIF